jgi:general secretion pathway protein D
VCERKKSSAPQIFVETERFALDHPRRTLYLTALFVLFRRDFSLNDAFRTSHGGGLAPAVITRSIQLETTQRNLIGFMAVAMSLSAGFAHAGLQERMAAELLTSAAVGQQAGSGSIFSGFSSSQPATPNEPFAARNVSAAAAAVPSSNGVTRLPPTGAAPTDDDRYGNTSSGAPQQMTINGQVFTAPMLTGNPSGTVVSGVQRGPNPSVPANIPQRNPSLTGNRGHSDAMLRQARMALAVGDIRRASDMVAQSRQDQIRYAPNEDSPDRVAAAIAKYVEISKLDRGSEENRRTYARMWMEQAQDLLQWNELEQAEKLAELAAQQHVTFGPFDNKPDELIRRIAAVREQNRPITPQPVNLANAGPVGSSQAARQQAITLMRNIRSALAAGQIAQAEFMCRQLDAMRIPEKDFGPGEDSPGHVFDAVHQAQRRAASGVIQAGGTVEVGGGVNSAVYDPSRDHTHNMQVADVATDPVPSPPDQPGGPSISPDSSGQSPGYSLFQQGEAALKARDRDRALQLFRQASAYSSQLDPVTAERLQDHLSLLSAPKNPGQHAGAAGQPGAPLDAAAAAQQSLVSQVFSDMTRRESEAKAMREKDPKGALALLQETRKKVEASGVEQNIRDRWLRQIDRSIEETQQFIAANRSRIDLDEKNNNVRGELNREAMNKQQVQQKLAELVDQFNKLTEEQRYEEAEVIAKRAEQLAPHELVVQVMKTKAKIQRAWAEEMRIKEAKEDGVVAALDDVDRSAVPFGGDPLQFPDASKWKDLTGRRLKAAMDHTRHRRSQQEIDIEKKLQTPVNYSCHNRPLNEVLNQLAKLVNINIHIDEEGLREEGKSADMPVTMELNSDIMLKSYLNLLLEKNHLCYIIKHEVLNVTSESKKSESSQIYQVVYPVGDLVMPIPNFVASPRMGLAGALHDAMSNAVGTSGGFGTMTTPMAVVSNSQGHPGSSMINPAVMANAARPGLGNQAAAGPGGAGGGTNPDFDSLIDLITQTIAPPTWDHNGGKGSVAPAPANLSLVISQTQEVHEEIVDLLEQLRRMQDLQVTIEVRFITLNDNFFERIGVDFDFTLAKNIANPQANGFTAPQAVTVGGNTFTAPLFTGNPNGTVVSGIQAAGNNPASAGIFTADNSIQFTQGSYALGVPQFGAFDAAAGATVGFAILSDIEAFFFINAASGDRRTNVLQAPKVTLFNGQQAFVSDTSQTPFVISVIPVVGDFAAAQQPVIVVLSEGTFMTVQAVVSNDRRFVRLTIVPFFSKIGNVQTFTFQGTDTTTTNTTRNGIVNQATNLFNNNNDQSTTSHSGVTVQLPTFSFVTVTTTVSVPDGGTVLLGGIKRLSEGRNEFGVPILDEIPYLNRLFKNVGIGRETSSLMMMVTPRIIIQEEEEDKLGISAATP